MAKKPKIKLRNLIVERPLITGGDGGYHLQSPIDPAEMDAALSQLCERFGVGENDWKGLAATLALKGGFVRIEKATGPVPHWGRNLRAALVLAVEHWAHTHGKAITATFQDAGFLTYWGEVSGQVERTGTLEVRYYEARREDDPLLWVCDKLKNEAADEYWPHAAGLTRAFLSQARLDRGMTCYCGRWLLISRRVLCSFKPLSHGGAVLADGCHK